MGVGGQKAAGAFSIKRQIQLQASNPKKMRLSRIQCGFPKPRRRINSPRPTVSVWWPRQ
ncbi:hypothetical protein SBBP1_580038 [Burkholderiales bacterium]|nr:hypothetical protein SBBP1_580038 [Burkholderiales bacterium]